MGQQTNKQIANVNVATGGVLPENFMLPTRELEMKHLSMESRCQCSLNAYLGAM